jgi:demethylmenaquinone methyltransferase / 2-methoxy-6-polyprenyl-1,4-benzoquinol methylase
VLNHSSDEWNAVKRAIEQAVPFYESISEAISLGLAGTLRRRAIRRIESSRKDWVLDSGTGPGVSSRLMLEDKFEKVVGLDPSLVLLRSARARLTECFYPVQGVAENLPFRDGSIAGAITCFSLRDVRDKAGSMVEFARVIVEKGRFEIVDIGKPDNLFFQRLISIYIVRVMPIMARVLIGRRARGNPFRMIIPTFFRLPTNQNLVRLAEGEFGRVGFHEFLFGGLVIVDALRTDDVHG